ncbi:NAD-dependent epimerase/dehydratase family protein [Aeromicrobium chenweiae]|uniref:GDP-mannose 4,6-dehydratase n=1 Tax=Aeromicrobium chenweiae TaxID=2079793 RepID=A0A2S0WIP0_9ACTN|nr:NAD-dependent epimerase/dehydratase family protein [Aeromicrobium chenweiae]AWB91193.1 GDP-mannose 4,6-dehydratase [Aeromicrobium chenweiae]TGN31711.1 NAD-dependent epimerase/dehydratase family protein [Aeromicrobium chenweiae]
MNTSILITGGAGFIGANLARAALADGRVGRVVVMDDLSMTNSGGLDDVDVELHESSILDETALKSALKGIDAVVHLAAIPSVPRSIANPMATHQANATGTLALLEGCRSAGVNHVVCSSSSSVYGSNPALPKSEREWVRPMSPYAVSKLATEQYLLAYQSSFGLSTLPFRFFNVYGPGQTPGHAYAAAVPTFIDALLRESPVLVNGDGSQSRDFTFVGSVCEILIEAAVNTVSSPEPVNLAFGARTDLMTLIDTLEEVTGKTARVEHRAPRPGDVPHSEADNSSLRDLFPDLQPVGLQEGLHHTVDWFRSRY